MTAEPTAELDADPRRLLTTKQAADFLGLSPYTVTEYVRKGYLRPTRLDGHQYRFRLDVLWEFVDQRTGD